MYFLLNYSGKAFSRNYSIFYFPYFYFYFIQVSWMNYTFCYSTVYLRNEFIKYIDG